MVVAAATDAETEALAERVRAAMAAGAPLAPEGGGSKTFYGEPVAAEPLSLADYRGVVHYEPTELVLTARAGTPLAEIETLLAGEGQMLAAEPPQFANGATLGGAVAAGLSGPRRPWAGALRDHVLGVRMIDGRGRPGRFGGEVMKNVAGYDVARLMTGSLGTLGVLLEVSLKVLPRPAEERTVVLEASADGLHQCVEQALRAGTPVTGAAHDGGRTLIRIGGAASAVEAGMRRLGGEPLGDGDFWRGLRDHTLPFFEVAEAAATERLWRIALPPGTGHTELPGRRLVDWGGQLEWLWSDAEPEAIRRAAAETGGHATVIRGTGDGTPVFTPLTPGLRRLHERLKSALDPAGILNPGRMYPHPEQPQDPERGL